MGGEFCKKDDETNAETDVSSLIAPPARDKGARDNVSVASPFDVARRLDGDNLVSMPTNASTARDTPYDFGRRLDSNNLVSMPTADSAPGSNSSADTSSADQKTREDVIAAHLGHLTQKRFTLPAKPKHRHVTWHHRVDGPMASAREVLSDETAEGPSSTFVLQPRVVGTKTVTTTIEYVGHDGASASEQLPDVRFQTPAPTVELVKADSISARGKVPVIDRLQIGEELVLTVKMIGAENLTASDLHAYIANGNLRVTSVVPLGHHIIEVHALPTAVGDSPADLYLTPYETTSLDVPSLKLALTIEAMTDEYDYGGGVTEKGRPHNTADAVRHFGDAITRVFSQRTLAVDDLLAQKDEKDPPIERPLWQEIALALAEAALAAVTAGLGVKFAHAVGRVIGAIEEPAWHEVAKVFAEETLNGAKSLAANSVPGREADAPTLGLTTYFHHVQHEQLGLHLDATKGKATTSADARASDLDRDQPGEGMRLLMQLAGAMEATADTAYDSQYMRSFEAWCSLLSRTSLPAVQSTAAASTDLSGLVDAEQTKAREAGVGVGFCPAAAPIPGVLRITVRRVSGADDTNGPMFAIESAQLPGLTNHLIREQAGKVALRDLRIPIVVAFSDSEHSGANAWVFSRDEAGNVLVDPPDSALLAQAAKARGEADVAAAARHILEVELGDARVKPGP